MQAEVLDVLPVVTGRERADEWADQLEDLLLEVGRIFPREDLRRQAAYDLRKLRSKGLVAKPGRTRRYHVPPSAARTIAALLTLRDQVIAPPSGRGPQPAQRTQTCKLDPHRSRLRNPPDRHADPLPRPRHHHSRRCRIDNILSIGEPQAPSAREIEPDKRHHFHERGLKAFPLHRSFPFGDGAVQR